MPSPHIELPQMPESQLFHRCLTRSAMIGGFPNRRYTRHLVFHQAAGYQKSFVIKDFCCVYLGKSFTSKRYVIQQPASNLIAEKAALLATQQRFVDLPSKRTDSSLGTPEGVWQTKVEKIIRSIKN